MNALQFSASASVQINHQVNGSTCLSDINTCASTGVTFQFDFKTLNLVEDCFILSNGGHSDTSSGLAVYYKYGRFNIRVSTATAVYHTTTTSISDNTWHNVGISWTEANGLGIYLDDKLLKLQESCHSRVLTATVTKKTLFIGQYGTTTDVKQSSCGFIMEPLFVYYAPWPVVQNRKSKSYLSFMHV